MRILAAEVSIVGGRLNRWMVGLGVGGFVGLKIARRIFTPRYPDVALHAGLELLSRPRTVLAIAPHPLDLEWFAGGTCFLFQRAGGSVTAAVLSSGGQGGPVAQTAQIREKEQLQAGATLGYRHVEFLGLTDGSLRAQDVVPRLERLMAEVRPDVILTFDPHGPLPFSRNPDHAAAGAAVLELVRAGISEQCRVYLYGTGQPNVMVDITEVLQEKESAVRAHRSQMRGPDALSKWAVRTFSRLGRGRTPVMYAETFYRLV